MNAQQLKNSILQEAIEGRLVLQDPNDEPASVLLDRIRKEKARLVKEGKLKKKDLVETPISEDEIPFEIPESWEWCRLSTLFNFIDYRGSTPNKIKTGIPLVTAKNVKRGYNDYSIKDYISTEEYENRKSRGISKKGDILFTTEAPLGNVSIADLEKFSAGQRLITLQSYDGEHLYNKTTMYFMLADSFQKSLIEKKTGTTVAGIKASRLKEVLIPLPPLAEQKRIVEKIEQLLPKVEEYGKAQEALDKLNAELPERLKKSILQEAIEGRLVPQDPNDEPASVLLDRIRKEKARLVKEGKLKKKDLVETPISEEEIPFEIPESWEWVRVRDVFMINPKVHADDNADAAFIPMEKIEACYGSNFSYLVRKWKDIKSSFTCFANGGVAFAKITPCFQNRKSMILKNLPNGIGAGTTELKVLRQYSETIVREYLLYFLASSYFIDEASFKGTANQQRIIVGYLENKPFPLPPLAEQKRIVEKIEQLLGEVEKLK